jgi:LCP family protein required for cell wall assembly
MDSYLAACCPESSLEMSLTCPRCNASSPAGSTLCVRCGGRLRGAATERPRGDRPTVAAGGRTSGPVIASSRRIDRRPRTARQPAPRASGPRQTRESGLSPARMESERPGQARPRQAGPRRPARRPRPWYHRWRITVPLAILALLLTGMAAGAWYINERFDALDNVSTPPPEISGKHLGGDENITIDTGAARQSVEEAEQQEVALEEAPEGSVVILLMGVDAYPGQPIDVNVRADSMSVVYLDGDDHSCRMLSIPRDTQVQLRGYGFTKLNSALPLGGIPYQQLVIEQVLGMNIDHYGLIDFSGLIQVVDAIGGIRVTNDEAFTTRDGMNIASGDIMLNGVAALAYSRYRDGPDGDYGRQHRQQQVIQALMSEGATLDLVTAVPEFLDMLESHVRTDLSPTDMVDLAQRFRSGCTADTLETASLEGTVELAYDDIMEEDLSFVLIEDEEIERKVAWLRGDEG